jgi:glutathione S-transferase
MYQLYYSPGLASLAPHFTLQEIGAPYELKLIDRSAGQHKTNEYLSLNPNGRIPTFVDGDFVIFESAAICLHLADKHPEACLIPAIGTTCRAHTYQWIAFLTNTLQADLWQYYRPEFYVEPERRDEFRSVMEGHVARHLGVIDRWLSDKTFMAGESLSVADLYLFMLGRWSRNLNPATRTFPHLSRLMERIVKRPSVNKVFQLEHLAPPYY